MGPVFAAVLGLLTVPAIAWLFAPEDIGRLSMLQVAVSFSLLFFSGGLDQAYVREFHEVPDRPGLLKAVLIPCTISLGVGLVFVATLPWSISRMLFGDESAALTVILCIAVVAAFYSRFFSLVLRMHERGLAYSLGMLLPKLLFLAAILWYVAISAGRTYENLLCAQTVALVVAAIVLAWTTRAEWMKAIRTNLDRSKQWEMIRYGIPLVGGGLAFWGLTAMDRMFLRAMTSFEDLGVYSVAINFAGAALVFQAIFSTVWAPTVYRWAAEGVDPRRIQNIMEYVTFTVIVIWSLAGMLSWIVADILPAEYSQVQYILLAAMAYPLLYTLSEATGVGIGITRKTIYAMAAAIASLLANAIGNYILIPHFDAAGAAMASAVAFFIFLIVRTEASKRVWWDFERGKIYLFVSGALALSILMNISSAAQTAGPYMWGGIMTLGMFVYRRQAVGVLEFVIARARGA